MTSKVNGNEYFVCCISWCLEPMGPFFCVWGGAWLKPNINWPSTFHMLKGLIIAIHDWWIVRRNLDWSLICVDAYPFFKLGFQFPMPSGGWLTRHQVEISYQCREVPAWELTISHPKALVDDFPFPKVGYVSSLEGTQTRLPHLLICSSLDVIKLKHGGPLNFGSKAQSLLMFVSTRWVPRSVMVFF